MKEQDLVLFNQLCQMVDSSIAGAIASKFIPSQDNISFLLGDVDAKVIFTLKLL